MNILTGANFTHRHHLTEKHSGVVTNQTQNMPVLMAVVILFINLKNK